MSLGIKPGDYEINGVTPGDDVTHVMIGIRTLEIPTRKLSPTLFDLVGETISIGDNEIRFQDTTIYPISERSDETSPHFQSNARAHNYL